MRLFYKGPGYKLSWARDVNYRTMMEALLHYAWKCPTGEKMAYSQGRMDGRMNNGWRDGGENHQCNLCLTKLKSGPGKRPWCSGPSRHVSLRILRWARETAQEGVLIRISFLERAGSRQRSSQVSARYLNTKTVLFSLPQLECSRVHSSLYVYLSNVLQPKALKWTEWGQSRNRDVPWV